MATRDKKLKEKVLAMVPEMVKGSHLTVWTYPDGSTKLEWDDEALLSDVRNAILKAESTIPAVETKPKRTRKIK
jgi:SRSO17 transposase